MHACDVVTIEIKTSSRLPQNEFVQFDSSGDDSILVISDVNVVVEFFFFAGNMTTPQTRLPNSEKNILYDFHNNILGVNRSG